MASQSSDIRNCYIRMPREVHMQLMISSVLNKRSFNEEMVLAATEYAKKISEATKKAAQVAAK